MHESPRTPRGPSGTLGAVKLPVSPRIALALSLSGLAVVACQKPKQQPTTQAPAAQPKARPDQGPSPSPAAPQTPPWSQMSHAQKMVFMKEVVTPRMAESFQAHDPEGFAEFTCATCHGPSAAEGDFHMPTPALPRLGDFEVAKQEHPKDMAFMMEKVVPQMADLLQEPVFDPKTQKGFGCFECHLPADNAG